MKFQLFGILSLLLQLSFPEVESRRVHIERKLVSSEQVDTGKDGLADSSSTLANALADDDKHDKEGNPTVSMDEEVNKLERIVEKDGEVPEITNPRLGFTILGHLQSFLEQVAYLMGSTPSIPKGQRRQKGIEDENLEENLIQPSINYREELRTTVGAILGKEECLKKAACRAGKYLKDVKGKELIIVFLEKFSPEKWIETVQVVRDAVIQKTQCQYKCFEH